jgi:hypothetical protein
MDYVVLHTNPTIFYMHSHDKKKKEEERAKDIANGFA